MMPRGRFAAFLRSRRANAAIEFALTVPVLLAFMGGIVEFGRAFQVYATVNRLATRFAIAYADCSDNPTGTCGTELGIYTTPAAMQNFAPQLDFLTAPNNGGQNLRIFDVTMTGGVVTKVNYVYPAGQTLSATELQAAQNAIANNTIKSPEVVVVTVNYTHSLMFFKTLVPSQLANTLGRGITYTVAQLKI